MFLKIITNGCKVMPMAFGTILTIFSALNNGLVNAKLLPQPPLGARYHFHSNSNHNTYNTSKHYIRFRVTAVTAALVRGTYSIGKPESSFQFYKIIKFLFKNTTINWIIHIRNPPEKGCTALTFGDLFLSIWQLRLNRNVQVYL